MPEPHNADPFHAELQWRRHKAPMACYGKPLGVYAGHLARTPR